MLLLLAACAWRRAPEVEVDPLAAPLAEADGVWARRDEEGGLDRAAAAYEALLATGPTDPRVLARVSRARWALGQAATDPAAARDQLETGRGFGTDCLLGYPAFAAAVGASRWVVVPDAVADLDASAAPCLTWAAANGLSLVDLRGPGAALDVVSLRPLAERAYALEPAGADGYTAWVAAVAVLLDRTPVDDVARATAVAAARARLDEAVRLAPDDAFLVAERGRWARVAEDEPAPAP